QIAPRKVRGQRQYVLWRCAAYTEQATRKCGLTDQGLVRPGQCDTGHGLLVVRRRPEGADTATATAKLYAAIRRRETQCAAQRSEIIPAPHLFLRNVDAECGAVWQSVLLQTAHCGSAGGRDVRIGCRIVHAQLCIDTTRIAILVGWYVAIHVEGPGIPGGSER